MKNKSLIIPVVLLGLITVLTMTPALTAQEGQQAAQKAQVSIPPQVKSILTEGAETRQARLDIPFSFVDKEIFLPAQMNLHRIFFFKVKNADLGFVEPAAAGEKAKEKKEGQEEISAFEATPAMLQSRTHVFLDYKQLDGSFSKEVYIPLFLQVDGGSYEAEKEEIFTTGYPLPPGKYLLSMAIASQDLQKIGTQYLEFTLPDPTGFAEELGVTPVFCVNKMDRMSAAETSTEIHKDFFTYSVLQVEANMNDEFAANENLDIFFFIFGAQTNAEGRSDIVINYEVLKGEEVVIRYAETKYDMPLVSQPLPLKRTVLVKTTTDGTTTEKQEQRDIDPGEYALSIKIKDINSGKTLDKVLNFTVK